VSEPITAEELRRHLSPMADSNPLASFFLACLDSAEDPDAEAERIVEPIRRVLAHIAKMLPAMIETVNSIMDTYVEAGIEHAEQHANREAP
jgi:hypothetical protein